MSKKIQTTGKAPSTEAVRDRDSTISSSPSSLSGSEGDLHSLPLPPPPAYNELFPLNRRQPPPTETNVDEDDVVLELMSGSSSDVTDNESPRPTETNLDEVDLPIEPVSGRSLDESTGLNSVDTEREQGPETSGQRAASEEHMHSNAGQVRRFVQSIRADRNISEEGAEELEMMPVENDGRRTVSLSSSRSEETEMSPLSVSEEIVSGDSDETRSLPGNAGLNGDFAPDESDVETGNNSSHARRSHRRQFKCDLFIPIVQPIATCIGRLIQRGIWKWPELSDTKKIVIVLLVTLFMGLLLFLCLFPASFVNVEYNEIAFIRNKVTGKIDYSHTYGPGCYLKAPQDEIVSFKSTAHFVSLDLEVMNTQGLSISLEIMLQYFLRPNELKYLFWKYHWDYDDVIQHFVRSSVKNTAVYFSLDEYRLERPRVEAAIYRSVKQALSGTCCPKCCPDSCEDASLCERKNCDPRDDCSRGEHVEVPYFQLGAVTVPEEVLNRFLTKSLLDIQEEREFLIQDKAVVVKRTELMVQKLRNEAEEVRQSAHARSHEIGASAAAHKERVVQLAFAKALGKMYSHLNVTDEEQKLSLMFIHALKDVKDNLLAFNYDKNTAFSP